MGVFSLVAHFQPNHRLLRAAALLHDVGHYPFSHTLEQLPGIDHHAATRERLLTPPIAPLLENYGLEPNAVISLVTGEVQSPLRNNEDILQADHLDSWARGAQARGQLTSGADLLKNMWLTGSHLETDSATAERLIKLIVAEAHFHLSAANLGSSTVLERLTSALLKAGVVTLDALADMTDAELSFHLLNTTGTKVEAQKLWFGPERLASARRIEEKEGIVVSKDKFYLSLPRVNGKAATSSRIRELLASVETLKGDYVVYWEPST